MFDASLNTFPIENLTTGTYYLKIEAINRDNEIIHTKKRHFYKINKDLKNEIIFDDTFTSLLNNKDTLKQYIEYLHPLQSPTEYIRAKNLDYENIEILKNYFYSFGMIEIHSTQNRVGKIIFI